MLTQLFKAARIEGHPPLSYAGHFIHLGITDAARRLEELSIRENLPPKDNLATRFLDVAFSDADFESRFLQDAWSTLTGKIEPVITETILKSLQEPISAPQTSFADVGRSPCIFAGLRSTYRPTRPLSGLSGAVSLTGFARLMTSAAVGDAARFWRFWTRQDGPRSRVFRNTRRLSPDGIFRFGLPTSPARSPRQSTATSAPRSSGTTWKALFSIARQPATARPAST